MLCGEFKCQTLLTIISIFNEQDKKNVCNKGRNCLVFNVSAFWSWGLSIKSKTCGFSKQAQ
jgi:hypothetical protein